MVGIKYVAPIMEPTGYGEAARDYAKSMLIAGVDLTIDPINVGQASYVNHGPTQELIAPLVRRQISYSAVISHCSPEQWHETVEPGKLNIGMFAWETDKLPTLWANEIANMRPKEVWLPSQFNVDVCVQSGVTNPLYIMPHIVDLSSASRVHKKLDFKDVPPETFMFYSIFQWTQRKNPEGLLAAYFSEFTQADDVTLILKTYDFGFERKHKESLTSKVVDIRRSMGSLNLPHMLLVMDLLSHNQVIQLHNRGDCYVAPHRGEGWGYPIATAMGMGKPVISTGWSGNLEYMNEDNSYLLNYQLTPVTSMLWSPWYNAKQMWAEPDIAHLKKCMRHCYETRGEADPKREQAERDMCKYSPEEIGLRIKNRVEYLRGL